MSDEPGYYEDNNFGIRIENVIMVREVALSHAFGDKPWLGFEHATMVPLCRKLIDTALLTDGEIKYINDYHAEVLEKTTRYFEGDELTMDWLKRETGPYVALRASLVV
jgi:Xaa-Pro aminopeptidase